MLKSKELAVTLSNDAQQPAALPTYTADQPIPIPRDGTWPRSVHQFDLDTIAALLAAEATGRPLLLRGDPGNGKSQTARAAAHAANRPFVSVVIDGRTEASDLKWRFDAVARLADAQIASKDCPLPEESAYLVPGPLWWAYQWEEAQKRLGIINQQRRHRLTTPATPPEGWAAPQGRVVLLIDEIDKADPDLPNALLEVLANLGFREPYGGSEVRCTEATRPLVILTTNEERELPHAFLRRCMVHSLHLPTDRTALVKRFMALGEQHQQLPGRRACHVMEAAAGLVADARARLDGTGLYMPGTSEFLDLVAAVSKLGKTEKAQTDLLQQIAPFSLDKAAPRHR